MLPGGGIIGVQGGDILKIPGISRKGNGNGRSEIPKTKAQANDSVYAQIRHMRNELVDLRRVVTDLKRDVARIDRKGYRDLEKAPPNFIQNGQECVKSGYGTNWG